MRRRRRAVDGASTPSTRGERRVDEVLGRSAHADPRREQAAGHAGGELLRLRAAERGSPAGCGATASWSSSSSRRCRVVTARTMSRTRSWLIVSDGSDRAHRRYSALPVAPATGLGSDAVHVQPVLLHRGHDHGEERGLPVGGSVTTPVPVQPARPTSNCGLTRTTRSPSAAPAARRGRASTRVREMNDRSATTRSAGPPRSSARQPADRGAAALLDPRVAAPPRARAGRDRRRPRRRVAAPRGQQDLGEAAGRRADVDAAPPATAALPGPTSSRAATSLCAARPTHRGPSGSTTISSSASTGREGLVAGAPPTVHRRRHPRAPGPRRVSARGPAARARRRDARCQPPRSVSRDCRVRCTASPAASWASRSSAGASASSRSAASMTRSPVSGGRGCRRGRRRRQVGRLRTGRSLLGHAEPAGACGEVAEVESVLLEPLELVRW